MNDDLTFRAVIAATLLVTGVLLGLSPRLSPKGVVLGVRVPEAHLGDPVVRGAVRRFRAVNLAAAVLLAAACFLPDASVVLWAILAQIAFMLASYLYLRRGIARHKAREGWFTGLPTRVVGQVSEDLERWLPEPRVPWLAFALGLVSIVASVLAVASIYDRLPDTIPTHWGTGFEPDQWAPKSVGSVYTLSFVNAGMLVLFFVISLLLTTLRVQTRSGSGIRGRLRTRMMVYLVNRALGWFVAALVLSLSFAQVATFFPSLVKPSFLLIMAVSLGGSLALVVAIVRGQLSLDDDLRRLDLGPEYEAPDNDRFYKWGMFYYNPDDPAVVVEKRFGAGFDFNYARWQGKAFVAFIFLVLLASFAPLFF